MKVKTGKDPRLKFEMRRYCTTKDKALHLRSLQMHGSEEYEMRTHLDQLCLMRFCISPSPSKEEPANPSRYGGVAFPSAKTALQESSLKN